MVRRVWVVQKRFKKGGAAAPSAPPLNPPMLNALCIWQELEIYDYEKDTTQKTFPPTFTCSIVRNHTVRQGGLQSCHDYYSRKSSLRLDVRFESSWASVSLPGVTAGASCKGWMFLLANSSIINGNFQSFSSPTGILLLSAFLSLSSKSLARYLRSMVAENCHYKYSNFWKLVLLFFCYFDLFLIFLFKIKASESKM